MPLTLTMEQFKSGRRYVRSWAEGVVSGDDAQRVASRIAAGGDLEGVPLLNVMASKVDLAPEARKIFAGVNSGRQEMSKMAVVAASAPLRVTLSFVVRLAGMADHTKFFSTEPEALAWLEAASAGAEP